MADSKIINRAMPISAFIPLGSLVFVRAAVVGKSSYAVLLGCSLHRRVPIWAALSFFKDLSRLCKRDDRRSESAARRQRDPASLRLTEFFRLLKNRHSSGSSI